MSIVVVPHGTGIGDFVNIRPLTSAVIAHHSGQRVQVLGPAQHEWLLPNGASIMRAVPWVRPWNRMPHDHIFASWLGRLDVGTIRRVANPKALAILAQGLTYRLEMQGFEVVNLLEGILSLDLDHRWTPGPWRSGSAHVIDLLAAWLDQRGIIVPRETRKPRLKLPAQYLGASPVVILNPTAGSTLKEPLVPFWVDLASQLLTLGIRPYILAAPGRSTASQIQSLISGTEVLSSASVRHVSGWLAGADVVVSPDSGILHLAAALGRPTVGLFGATDSAFLGPYGVQSDSIISSDLTHEVICRGCWAAQMLPTAQCSVYEVNCLQGVNASTVVRTILIRLGRDEELDNLSVHAGSCGAKHDAPRGANNILFDRP